MLIYISIFTTIIGLIFKIFPPKKINGIYGYRTINSMKNQKIWDYSQVIGANSMILVGVLLGVIGLIFYLVKINYYILELFIFLISFLLMIIVDEYKVRKYGR